MTTTRDDTALSRFPRIAGRCPMGCGETLFVASGGYITCAYIDCPRPDAVATLLDQVEADHIVEFYADKFFLRHPLRERIDGELFRCGVHEYVAACEDMPGPGRFRVRRDAEGWSFVRLT